MAKSKMTTSTSTTSTSSATTLTTSTSGGEEHVRVYLRLRPMDKLETSKRSKDCIELHENPQLVTVDSPLLGTFDFTFHQVCMYVCVFVYFVCFCFI